MRCKERLVSFIIIASFCICIHQSSSPLAEILPIVHARGSIRDSATTEPSGNHRSSYIAYQNKFSHGSTARGGGHPGNTNGEGSRVPNGGAVIPFYAAAGARGGHHNRHSGGSRGKSTTGGAATLAVTSTFACLILFNHCNWHG